MKKIAVVMALVALSANAGFAQTNRSTTVGQGARQGTTTASDDMAWAPAVGSLVVLGVVVGVTAAAAASTPGTFSH